MVKFLFGSFVLKEEKHKSAALTTYLLLKLLDRIMRES